MGCNGKLIENLSKIIQSMADELADAQTHKSNNCNQISLDTLSNYLVSVKKAVRKCRQTINNADCAWHQMQRYARGVTFFISDPNVEPLNDFNIVFGEQGCAFLKETRKLIKYNPNLPIRIDAIKLVTHLKIFEVWMYKTSSLNLMYRKKCLKFLFFDQLNEVIDMAQAILLPLKLIEQFPSHGIRYIDRRSASLRLFAGSIKLTDQESLQNLYCAQSRKYRSICRLNGMRKIVKKRRR